MTSLCVNFPNFQAWNCFEIHSSSRLEKSSVLQSCESHGKMTHFIHACVTVVRPAPLNTPPTARESTHRPQETDDWKSAVFEISEAWPRCKNLSFATTSDIKIWTFFHACVTRSVRIPSTGFSTILRPSRDLKVWTLEFLTIALPVKGLIFSVCIRPVQ